MINDPFPLMKIPNAIGFNFATKIYISRKKFEIFT